MLCTSLLYYKYNVREKLTKWFENYEELKNNHLQIIYD